MRTSVQDQCQLFRPTCTLPSAGFSRPSQFLEMAGNPRPPALTPRVSSASSSDRRLRLLPLIMVDHDLRFCRLHAIPRRDERGGRRLREQSSPCLHMSVFGISSGVHIYECARMQGRSASDKQTLAIQFKTVQGDDNLTFEFEPSDTVSRCLPMSGMNVPRIASHRCIR